MKEQSNQNDHEFGTQIVHTWVCAHCGKISPYTGPPDTQEQDR